MNTKLLEGCGKLGVILSWSTLMSGVSNLTNFPAGIEGKKLLHRLHWHSR